MHLGGISKAKSLRDTLLSLDRHYKRGRTSFNYLKQIHCVLITGGLSQDTFFLTKFLRCLTFCQPINLSYASLLFGCITSPTIDLWNTMIRAFSTSSRPHMSLAFYARMRQYGVYPDKHTFPLLLKAFSKLKNEDPYQLYAHIVKFGFDFDNFVRNSLISVLAKCGYMEDAHRVFGESTRKDVVAWTSLIDGYVRNNCAPQALKCFLQMRSTGTRVDEVTVVSVLCAAGMLGDIWFGRWVHGFYVEAGRVQWDIYVGSALVDMYSKCGCCEDARKVFYEIPRRNVVSWSALIAGYIQCKRYRDALLVFHDMLLENVLPNEFTLTSVLTACAHLGSLDQGRWVHGYINRKYVEVNSTIGTALIDMYARCGCIDEALSVFEELPVRDVYPWTAIINGYAMHGDAFSSLHLFSHMLRNGIQPNEVTFVSVLSACSHGGLLDEGLALFELMKHSYNLKPNVCHYGCIVDLLSRAGYLEEARKLIEDMPMEPTPGVWGALFGASMIHKAYELGEHIGKYLIVLQARNSGRYTLLANLYSTCHKWEAAAQVRKLMRGNGVGKIPGYSWIEVNGVIHEFTNFDKSHLETDDIYGMMDNMIVQLKLDDLFDTLS